MNIAYITPGFSGPEYASKYCNGQDFHYAATHKIKTLSRAMLMNGHNVTIFSFGVNYGTKIIRKSFTETIQFTEGNLEVKYSSAIKIKGLNFFNAFLLFWHFVKNFRKLKFHTIIFYNIFFISRIFRYSKKKKLRTILEYEDHILSRRRFSFFNKFFKKSENEIINNIDFIIAVTPELLSDCNNKNSIIIPGVLSDDLLGNINKANDNRVIINERVKLVFAGGIKLEKGPDLLLKALSFIDRSCNVYIIGDGPEKNELQNIANQVPEHHTVSILGFISREQMIQYFFEADILVNPHRINYYGGNMKGKIFPFKMIEYAATGNPIVSSEVGKTNNEIDKYIKFYIGDSPEELAKSISEVIVQYKVYREQASILQKIVEKEYSLTGIAQKLSKIV